MSSTFATWFDVAYDHAVAFGLGVVIGFVLTSRYKITRRNGGTDDM